MPVINVCSAGVSAPLSHGDIQRAVSQQHGEDSVTSIYLDQQLTVMAGSAEQWVGRVGDTGGGQYQVNIPHILGCLTRSMLEMVIMERFSSKASRVCRYGEHSDRDQGPSN